MEFLELGVFHSQSSENNSLIHQHAEKELKFVRADFCRKADTIELRLAINLETSFVSAVAMKWVTPNNPEGMQEIIEEHLMILLSKSGYGTSENSN